MLWKKLSTIKGHGLGTQQPPYHHSPCSVREPPARGSFLKWKLPSMLLWQDAEGPARINVFSLLWQMPLPGVIGLVGQRALPWALSHFYAPWPVSQSQKRWRMPKLIMSNGLHTKSPSPSVSSRGWYPGPQMKYILLTSAPRQLRSFLWLTAICGHGSC